MIYKVAKFIDSQGVRLIVRTVVVETGISYTIIIIEDLVMTPGVILGLALFHISVGDTDSGIECTLSKFTNDTKLSGAVTLEEEDVIQRYLDRLERWAHKIQGQVISPATDNQLRRISQCLEPHSGPTIS
ncbi:hypothetical protein TURU_008780 [Turdus rufiventris]|nr:hypothetical protein TURU_008780 [Turdus rufiventris]